MTEYWWRSWHGAPTDHKWLVVAARSGVKVGIVSAIAWALLDFASQHSERGSVTGFDPEVYAAYSGFSEGEVSAVIQAMTDKGILENGKFSNWDKRQPKSEAAIERANKSRVLRDVAPGCGTLREIAPDTESDTDTESDNREQITETETESDARDPFDLFQRALEEKGIVVSGEDGINSIQEMVKMGATVTDLRAGLEWKAANNGSKPIRYASSLIGPTRTAMQKRLQNGNGHSSGKTKYTHPTTGEVIEL